MKVGIIGSGGREDAICKSLKNSNKINKIFCFPGNAGTAKVAENVIIDLNNFEEIKNFVLEKKIDLIIIGPEKPLVEGLVDYLEKFKIKVFGPNKLASQLEGSKIFTKKICEKFNIPTAKFGVFEDYDSAVHFLESNKTPIVVKADGLAAGKGVSICNNIEEAKNKIKEIMEGKFKSSKKVVLEEFLEGEELSYFVISDNNCYKFFGSAQDHKKVGEGDVGPNTGGMGAYSPSNLLNDELENKIKKKIIEPTLKEMKNLGHPYTGFLYAGLMISNGEPYLIEYNIRMGDPECQVLMMRLKTDLLEILDLVTKNELKKVNIEWYDDNAITVVLCAKGYPGNYIKDSEIKNIDKVETDKNNQIFHAGTYIKDNRVFSSGGRVLNITSKANKLKAARDKSLENLKKISWIDGFFRRDIGWRAVNKK